MHINLKITLFFETIHIQAFVNFFSINFQPKSLWFLILPNSLWFRFSKLFSSCSSFSHIFFTKTLICALKSDFCFIFIWSSSISCSNIFLSIAWIFYNRCTSPAVLFNLCSSIYSYCRCCNTFSPANLFLSDSRTIFDSEELLFLSFCFCNGFYSRYFFTYCCLALLFWMKFW